MKERERKDEICRGGNKPRGAKEGQRIGEKGRKEGRTGDRGGEERDREKVK